MGRHRRGAGDPPFWLLLMMAIALCIACGVYGWFLGWWR